jgi:hypothetical protein
MCIGRFEWDLVIFLYLQWWSKSVKSTPFLSVVGECSHCHWLSQSLKKNLREALWYSVSQAKSSSGPSTEQSDNNIMKEHHWTSIKSTWRRSERFRKSDSLETMKHGWRHGTSWHYKKHPGANLISAHNSHSTDRIGGTLGLLLEVFQPPDFLWTCLFDIMWYHEHSFAPLKWRSNEP